MFSPETRPRAYIVTVMLNTHADHFGGYAAHHETSLAYDIAMVLDVDADSPEAAAAAAFTVGNRMAADTDGKTWPAWARSVSVGDVMLVRGWDEAAYVDLAVASFGFDVVTLTQQDAWNRPGGRAKMVAAGAAAPEAPTA